MSRAVALRRRAPLVSASDLFARLGPAEACFVDGATARFAWGAARVIEASGEGRMRAAEEALAAVAREIDGAEHGALLGGFSFEPSSRHGAARPTLRFVLPRISYVWDEAGSAVVVVERDEAAAARLADEVCAALAAPGKTSVRAHADGGAEVPSDDALGFEARVRAALGAIERGRVEKVVLVRRERVRRPAGFDPEETFVRLVRANPSARAFLLRRPGEPAFVGASPELLAATDGARVWTEALAGTRRSGAADGWTPKEMEEHRAVVVGVEAALRGLGAVRVGAREERVHGPVVHLRTPISCELAAPWSLFAIAAALHPTPALGGAPRDEALALLREVEGEDRGLYGGGVGVVDLAGRGQLAVAIRCAALDGAEALLFGGAGIVRGSRPEAERAETQAKLSVVAASLAGVS